MKIGNAFPSEYLKAADLNGRAVRVVIKGVSTEKIGDDQKPVLHFLGKDKALVLNKTNANRILEATGSDETDDWKGWSIVLYSCKVDFQGKRVDAIRVDDRPGSSQGPQRSQQMKETSVDPPAMQVPDNEPPPLTDEDVPFAWLLPLVLPLATLGMVVA